jgi:hypothetical protein
MVGFKTMKIKDIIPNIFFRSTFSTKAKLTSKTVRNEIQEFKAIKQ